MDWDELNGKLRGVVLELETLLLPSEVTDILDYIDHNEAGVAFELLCSQLYERDAGVSAQTVRQLAEIGSAMQLDPGQWQVLRIAS